MKTLISIKKDMEANAGLSLLIETLKTIAISQYYAAQKKRIQLGIFTKFFRSVESFVEDINLDGINHFFTNPKGRAQAIVAITSDAGFLGGLNMKVVNAALQEAGKMHPSGTLPTTIIIVGERGEMYVRGTGFPAVSFPGIQDEEIYSQAGQLRDYIYQKALAGEFGTVKVVYPRTVSLGVQSIEMVSFLPFQPANVNPVRSTKLEGEKNKTSNGVKQATPDVRTDMILESRPEDIIEYLVYLWMGMKLYDIFELSRLAEFSARYFHLEESGEKLKEEDKKTKLQYFRIRHELADRAIRELVAGRFVRGKK